MVVIGDSQWESLHTLSETLPNTWYSELFATKRAWGCNFVFLCRLNKYFYQSSKGVQKTLKIKSRVIFLMQIKLFVPMQNLWINFIFTHNQPDFCIFVITGQFRAIHKSYNWMEQELNDISYLKMEKVKIPTKMREKRCRNMHWVCCHKQGNTLGFTRLVWAVQSCFIWLT